MQVGRSSLPVPLRRLSSQRLQLQKPLTAPRQSDADHLRIKGRCTVAPRTLQGTAEAVTAETERPQSKEQFTWCDSGSSFTGPHIQMTCRRNHPFLVCGHVLHPAHSGAFTAPSHRPHRRFKQWYPIAVPEYLDPKRPHPLTILGKRVVVWQDGSGAWRCFDDACPHR